MLSLLLGVILGSLIYYKVIKPSSFWEVKNVLHEPGWPLFGSMLPMIRRKKHFMDITLDIYNKYPNERYVGYMQFITPMLLIRDIDLIKQFGVKEFEHFHDHLGFTSSENNPLLAKSLINLTGDKWKEMRATLSPAFTGSKMKTMYSLMAQCAENLANHFHGKQQVAVEMKDIFSRFTNDVIATTAFGIQVNSLKEPKNEFYRMGQNLTNFTFLKAMKVFFLQMFPKIAKMLNVQLLEENVCIFFRSLIKDNINKREKEGIIRPDLIHLLMQARKGQLTHDEVEEKKKGFAAVEESDLGKATVKMELTDDHITAQAVLFFFAGFDTASTVSAFMAHELAVHPDLQRRIQDEIDAVRDEHHGEISYESLMSMRYLDQVVCETLRMWPPGFQTDRICTKDYIIQPQKATERPILLEKNTSIVFPIIALHRDPRYYPDPDKFDPERFSDENKSKILPGTYLPFGVGPRNCIGSRFALVELKTLFVHLLTRYDLVPIEKTEIPIKISPKMMTFSPENGFHVAFKPRKLS